MFACAGLVVDLLHLKLCVCMCVFGSLFVTLGGVFACCCLVVDLLHLKLCVCM